MKGQTAVTYQTLQDEIIRRVRAREWLPGSLIPNEVDLAAEFGCARATMNRALRELADAGVLERKRRAGTRVAASPVRRATLRIPVIRDEVEAMGKRHSYRLLERQTTALPAEQAAAMAITAGAEFVHLLGLHLADDAPFQFEDRWVNPAAVPKIRQQSFETISPNEWLIREIPFSDGTLVLSSMAADAETARLLNTPRNAALFVVERTTWLSSTPITFVRMAYKPGYKMRSEL